jgi:hypothetical protein
MSRRSIALSLAALGLGMGLGACAPAQSAAVPDLDARLKQATVSVLGGEVTEASVTIANVKSTLVKHTWTATAGGRTYACDIDDQFALPSCEQAG